MSNTRKVYPAKPEWAGKKHPRYGDPEFPKVTPEELAKAREVFWDIFMVKHDSDCFNDFAHALGCDRNRAKQVYYFILYQRGFMQNQQMQERKIRGKLAVRIKKYTEFLDNPETIYQILARAEDEVEEEEEKRQEVKSKC
ncbi:hypothetical protein [Pectobacterium phage PcCB7V]|nr:hypothetical protein [Pectobacterium phage PcCB7V]